MRLLLSGDLHLGRKSSRVPGTVPGTAAADAWMRLVDTAIGHDVDAVLLSGDLVDEDNRYFEAIGPLERGLDGLHTAGIPVVAVAGNHDHDVLPALARRLPPNRLTLLGAGGRWEHTTLAARRGPERVHVLGWSFPSRVVRASPLDEAVPVIPTDAPVIGLLHGDLDVPTSPYAPLARGAFARWPAAAWLLGHIHAPGFRQRAGDVPLLYPGSPQPLDPGESGVHGVWIGELGAAHDFSARLVPVASVQYHVVSVDLSPCTTVSEARDTTVQALRASARTARADSEHVQHVAARVRLTGITSLHGTLGPLVSQLRGVDELGAPEVTGDGDAITTRGVTTGVTHVEDTTRAPHDLAALATGHDAIGLVARLLLDLEAGRLDAVDPALWRAACVTPAVLERAKPFAGVCEAGDVSEQEVAARLSRQAERLLDALLAQRTVTA